MNVLHYVGMGVATCTVETNTDRRLISLIAENFVHVWGDV
jgi:hypothetical protein